MTVCDQNLIDFVVGESRLLDAGRYEEWLDLFSEDGRYWMPLARGQEDRRTHASLLDEDKLLLRIRVERLAGARTFSQAPQSHGHHLLQTPVVVVRDPAQGAWETYTPFHYVEARGDDQTLFAGWARHSLCLEAGALRIRLKRVDLVNCEAAFGNVQLFP